MKRLGPRNPCSDGVPRHPIDRARVAVRYGNYSAFNGYHFTPSDYSELVCLNCLMRWRTKADYVAMLPSS